MAVLLSIVSSAATGARLCVVQVVYKEPGKIPFKDLVLHHHPQLHSNSPSYLHSFPAGRTIPNLYTLVVPTIWQNKPKNSSQSFKMQFTFTAILSLVALTSAAAVQSSSSPLLSRQNANRPVPSGACCIAATSLKQDVCNVNGQTGRCVPAGVNNCTYFFFSLRLGFLLGSALLMRLIIGGSRLTCIEDNRLTCDPNVLERGRPLCRLTVGA